MSGQVLYVCREDGDWHFLCGQSDHPKSRDPVVVGIGHLIDADSTLSEIADLPVNHEAERRAKDMPWVRDRYCLISNWGLNRAGQGLTRS